MDVRWLVQPTLGEEWERMEMAAQPSDVGVSHPTAASSSEQHSEMDAMEVAFDATHGSGALDCAHSGGCADTDSTRGGVYESDEYESTAECASGSESDEGGEEGEEGEEGDGEAATGDVFDKYIMSNYMHDPALEAREHEWDEYLEWLEVLGVPARGKEVRLWGERVVTSRMAVYLHFARLGVQMEQLQEQHVDSAVGWSKRGRACPGAHFVQVPLFQSSTNMHFNTAFTAYWWLDPHAAVVPLRKCRMDLYTKVTLCHVCETVPSETVHSPKRSVPKDTVDVDRAVRSIGGYIRKKVMRTGKKRRRSAAPVAVGGAASPRDASSSRQRSPSPPAHSDHPHPHHHPHNHPHGMGAGVGGAMGGVGDANHVPQWAHAPQRFDWDCGVACVEMVLKGFGYPEPAVDLRSLLQTESVWTIHLAHLLHDLHIPCTYLSQSIRANEQHFQNPFYADGNENLHEELHGVSSLFASAQAKGMAVHERVLSLPEIAKLILEGNVVIVVVDSRHLECEQCGHEKQRGANQHFAGHFVLLTGFSTASCAFEYMDPSSGHEKCIVSAMTLDVARKSEGTEFDTLVVWNEHSS
eukprot:TRINITY_DN376_c0_g1_i2.p1 TRINITY_DN376_c0_g1~~TRINITY_DN376_c0_g1_i2.p1  ORF type:complete len:592 (-),score=223.97 TRINITY_DN376_c0_g1_i2:366-2108(-)